MAFYKLERFKNSLFISYSSTNNLKSWFKSFLWDLPCFRLTGLLQLQKNKIAKFDCTFGQLFLSDESHGRLTAEHFKGSSQVEYTNRQERFESAAVLSGKLPGSMFLWRLCLCFFLLGTIMLCKEYWKRKKSELQRNKASLLGIINLIVTNHRWLNLESDFRFYLRYLVKYNHFQFPNFDQWCHF